MKITRHRKGKTGRNSFKDIFQGETTNGNSLYDYDFWAELKHDSDGIPTENLKVQLTYEELKEAIRTIEEFRAELGSEFDQLDHLKENDNDP